MGTRECQVRRDWPLAARRPHKMPSRAGRGRSPHGTKVFRAVRNVQTSGVVSGARTCGPSISGFNLGAAARGSGAPSVGCPPRPRCLLKVSLPSCFQPSPEASGLGVASYATSLSRERPARGPCPHSACFLFPSVSPVSGMGTTGAGAQDGCRRREKNSTVYNTV